MKIRLPYGASTLEAGADWGHYLGTIDIVPATEQSNPAALADRALRRPIGLDRGICDIVQPGETVAIIVSDAFRKTAVDEVLPVLLEGLSGAGVRDEDIRFVFATGTHRAPTPEEQARILGPEVYRRFKAACFVHDAHDTANMAPVGTTSRGTPVSLNRKVIECGRIIATGAVVLHYFGGFGGGRKSIVPGISSVETIAHNHAMNLHPTENKLNPAVRIGHIDGNPVAEDMLEAARFVKIDCVVNTVLNRDGSIAQVFAGELEAAHRAACELAYRMYAIPIDQRADLVISASAATRNFVQTHKALYNSYQAVKPNGRIILAAPCEEGLGGEQFEKWVHLGSRDRIIEGLRKQSEINGQTALSTVQKAPVTIMVTEMDEASVALLGARKAPSLDAALAMARDELPDDPAFYLMPSAAYSVPVPRVAS